MKLPKIFKNILPKPKKTQSTNSKGISLQNKYTAEKELDPSLYGTRRYETYQTIYNNCHIVEASVRYFLDLIGQAGWTFAPADHPEGERYAELAEQILTRDPQISFSQLNRQMAMSRFWGFSVHEWTAVNSPEGHITLLNIAPLPQRTIEELEVNDDGIVTEVRQTNPNTGKEIRIPRWKIVYLADDAVNYGVRGLGLFAGLVGPYKRLTRLEALELVGYETDLRGVPVGRVPFGELKEQAEQGLLTEEEIQKLIDPVTTFVKDHVRIRPELGVTLDSATYETNDDKQTPSPTPKYSIELMRGSSTSQPEVANAILRIQKEIARVLGTEALLLGDGSAGSMALSSDKTSQFSMAVDGQLLVNARTLRRDLLFPIWSLNGWPVEAMPMLQPEAVQYRDILQLANTLLSLSNAGATLDPGDRAVNHIRNLAGLPPMSDEEVERAREYQVSSTGGNQVGTNNGAN